MARAKLQSDWVLIPSSIEEIKQVRRRCRRLVTRRAAVAAGLSFLPASIPGVAIVSDIGLLGLLMRDIQAEFGLSADQAQALRPELSLLLYESLLGAGVKALNGVALRAFIMPLLRRAAPAPLNRYAARLLPLAEKAVNGGIGFAIFRLIGNRHIEDCAQLAHTLLAARVKTAV